MQEKSITTAAPRLCEVCATPLHRLITRQHRFCSRVCRDESQRGRRVPVEERACCQCGRSYAVREKEQRFCSRECSAAAQRKPKPACEQKPIREHRPKPPKRVRVTAERPCANCGASVRRSLAAMQSRQSVFCNNACRFAHRQGFTIERFLRHAEQTDGCWLWRATVDSYGYGVFYLSSRVKMRASRASWELHFGPIPDGMFVCHHCDQPLCVRPDHLFLGTHMANMRDAGRKGRTQMGRTREALTAAQVAEIRATPPVSYARLGLAAKFNVSAATIQRAARRETYRYLP